MPAKSDLVHIILGILVFAGVALTAIYFFPWQMVNWGSLTLTPAHTLTVTGTSQSAQPNQIASFTAGVNAVRDNQDEAISDVNTKIKAIIEAVKDFGIKQEDIKTQNLSVYQDQQTYYEEGAQKTRPGQWRVDNSISVTLRDVDRAGNLANVFTKNGATNVYGPNFTIDTADQQTDELTKQALADAQTQAEFIAQSSSQHLGKIISITAGATPTYPGPIYFGGGGGGGGGPAEPGTSAVSKSVTVIYELK